ncbi:MAG: caspase, EACC1-associated type [Candidatus Electronema sp. VV]
MAGKRYAILIASSRYPDEPGLTELRCPENDVDALNEVLRSPDFGQFAKTVVLKNKPSHEVLEQIETVLHDAGREDLVLIYFSGHGKLNPSGQLCLAAANTKLRTLGSTSIPVERIKSFFDAADTRQRILILDCCYSGAVGKDFVKGGVDNQLQLMSGGQGTFIMTASTGIQVAVEKEGDSLGLFTKHLVEGIRSGEADRNEDGFVDIHELYQHVYEKVRAEGAQEPMKWGLHAKGKMIVARSGKDAKEKHRQELRTKLCELAAQGYLSDRLLGESLKIVSMSAQEMTARERECSLLIERLADGRMSLADFVESWLRPEGEVIIWPWLAVVAALCVGAGWYFVSGGTESPQPSAVAPPKTIELPISPPAMGVISVSRQKAADLSPPNKLQPLEKLPKNEGKTIGQYIDHGDGTITDTVSKLMWKRCSEGLSGVNCKEGKTEKSEWDDAVKRFKDVEYAGYSDWRLPTIEELKTLVYCSNGVKDKDNGWCNDGSETPTINQQAFPNTEATRFWSGSPYAGYSDYAWYVHFGNSDSYYVNRSYSCAVRFVRGGQ